jgi:hypothetical protein
LLFSYFTNSSLYSTCTSEKKCLISSVITDLFLTISGMALCSLRIHDDSPNSLRPASSAQAASLHLRHQGEVSRAQRPTIPRQSHEEDQVSFCYKLLLFLPKSDSKVVFIKLDCNYLALKYCAWKFCCSAQKNSTLCLSLLFEFKSCFLQSLQFSLQVCRRRRKRFLGGSQVCDDQPVLRHSAAAHRTPQSLRRCCYFQVKIHNFLGTLFKLLKSYYCFEN